MSTQRKWFGQLSLAPTTNNKNIKQNSCNWIGLSSVLRPLQLSIGYMGDSFLQVKRPNQQYQSTEGESCKGK